MKKLLTISTVILLALTAVNLKSVAQDSSEKIYVVVDQQPQFKGGEKARAKYLVNEIQYPEEAAKQGIDGVVFVQFIVENDGTVTNIKIKRGVNELLDAEAIRVVQNMPNWTPGMQNGKPVRVMVTMPIRFKLDKTVD
jgi:protein TonB